MPRFEVQVVDDAFLKQPVIRLTDRKSPTYVEICPYFGSNMTAFRRRDQDIIYADHKAIIDRGFSGNFPLFPLPNRYNNRKWQWQGKEYSLKDIKRPTDETSPPLIHGLVFDQIWSFGKLRATPSKASVTTFFEYDKTHPIFPGYPFPCSLSLKFTLSESGVRTEYTVKNKGTTPLPYGFAMHPAFRVNPETLVSLPAKAVCEMDKNLLPTNDPPHPVTEPMWAAFDLRKGRPVQWCDFDHLFTDFKSGEAASIKYPEFDLYLSGSERFKYMVLYTLDKNAGFICLENQTCPSNAFNLLAQAQKEGDVRAAKRTNILTIPPGSWHSGHIDFRIVPRTTA